MRFVKADIVAVGAVVAVVLQQVRQSLSVGQVVDSDNIDIATLKGDLKGVATDTAETINCYSCLHAFPSEPVAKNYIAYGCYCKG